MKKEIVFKDLSEINNWEYKKVMLVLTIRKISQKIGRIPNKLLRLSKKWTGRK